MSSSPDAIAEDHINLMMIAVNTTVKIAESYINTNDQSKKFLWGKSHNCLKEATTLKTAALDFLKNIQNKDEDPRLTIYFFTKAFIETYNSIPLKDELKNQLQKNALNPFQTSLNKLLRLRSEHTSQEFLAPYIILFKENFRITANEENKRSQLSSPAK